ncbi:MAG: hypothetical protein PUD40_03765 [Bacteroidales bacterium]|nr:hypothetical protein [Bacteroidales bacterium]
MKVSPEYYDELFDYKGQWDTPSRCGLKLREAKGTTYIIVTELYQDNPGTSVTYTGKSLAQQVCLAKGLDLDKCVYIECTPDTNSKLSFYDEEYYAVDFGTGSEPVYHQLSPEEITEILGHKVIER